MAAFVPPFDQRQRYEVVAELLGHLPRSATVLDVGGFYRDLDGTVVLPIRSAAPGRRTVTVDLERDLPAKAGSHEEGRSHDEGGRHEERGSHEEGSAEDGPAEAELDENFPYAVADGTRLPFANAAFDVVSCLDVLEHVPRNRRAGLVAELFRVSRGYVVLAMPIADEGAGAREAALQRYITGHLGSVQEQLREHAQFGLPTTAEVQALLPPPTVSFGYGNLDRWALMMFAKYFLLGVPHNLEAFYRLDTEYSKLSRDGDLVGPFYRRVFVSAVDSASHGALHQVAKTFTPSQGKSSDVDEVLELVFDVLIKSDPERLRTEREVSEQLADHLERALEEARAHVVNLEARVRHLEEALEQSWAHIGNLERVRDLLEQNLQQAGAHIANVEHMNTELQKAAAESAAHIANLEEAASKSADHIANLEQVQHNLKDAVEGAQVHIRNLEAGHRAQVAVLEETITQLREVLRQVEASKVYRLYRLTQRISGVKRSPSA